MPQTIQRGASAPLQLAVPCPARGRFHRPTRSEAGQEVSPGSLRCHHVRGRFPRTQHAGSPNFRMETLIDLVVFPWGLSSLTSR